MRNERECFPNRTICFDVHPVGRAGRVRRNRRHRGRRFRTPLDPNQLPHAEWRILAPVHGERRRVLRKNTASTPNCCSVCTPRVSPCSPAATDRWPTIRWRQALIASSRDGSMRMIGGALNKGTFALMASPGPDERRGRSWNAVWHQSDRRRAVQLFGRVACRVRSDFTRRAVDSGRYRRRGRARGPGGRTRRRHAVDRADILHTRRRGFTKLGPTTDFDNIFASKVYLLSNNEIAEHPELPEQLIKAHAEGGQGGSTRTGSSPLTPTWFTTPKPVAPTSNAFTTATKNPACGNGIPYVRAGAVESVLAQPTAKPTRSWRHSTSRQ